MHAYAQPVKDAQMRKHPTTENLATLAGNEPPVPTQHTHRRAHTYTHTHKLVYVQHTVFALVLPVWSER